jgi:hypothetical protein
MKKTVLCLDCRSTFTDKEIEGANCCPTCKSTGIPASLLEKHTLTLTDHEWRCLFIWAGNYAATLDMIGINPEKVIEGIAREAKRQEPTMPNLSLFADVQDLATTLGTKATIFDMSGQEIDVAPEKKH